MSAYFAGKPWQSLGGDTTLHRTGRRALHRRTASTTCRIASVPSREMRGPTPGSLTCCGYWQARNAPPDMPTSRGSDQKHDWDGYVERALRNLAASDVNETSPVPWACGRRRLVPTARAGRAVGANPSGVARRGALLTDRGRRHLRAGQVLIDSERPGRGCRWGRPS